MLVSHCYLITNYTDNLDRSCSIQLDSSELVINIDNGAIAKRIPDTSEKTIV